jgi:hypothetical protein
MNTKRKRLSKEVFLKGGLISIIVIFMVTDCATAQKEFDTKITGPQMIIEPDTIRLGVAKVMGTQIVFMGKGFQPEDSVFISLLGVKTKDQVVDIPIADGDVDNNGYFNVELGSDLIAMVFKIGVLLRAKSGVNEKGEKFIIISQPPIPEGIYTVRAVSMESDRTAECKLMIKGPSILDRMKDWMGGLMGKIEKK